MWATSTDTSSALGTRDPKVLHLSKQALYLVYLLMQGVGCYVMFLTYLHFLKITHFTNEKKYF